MRIARGDTTLSLTSRSPNPLICLALVLSAVVFCGLIRYRLREMPLERDEGEYAYAGQLLLQGIPPYKLAYNMKLPGIYAAYALVMSIFGETPSGIHLGLLLLNAVTTLLLYVLTARLFGRLAAVVAACCYAVLSTSSSVLGFEAHATNFIVFPALLSILVLLFALDTGRGWLFLASGLLSGTAFLMKQHGVFFAVFCFFYLVLREREQKVRPSKFIRNTVLFGAGVIFPYAVTCWLLYRAGVFHEFWFWTVSYAGEYSKIGFHRAVRAFLENFRVVVHPAVPVWILAAVGVTAPLWNATVRQHSRFLLGLLACSFVALCPGGYFRPHYFILLLPMVAILTGVATSAASEKLETFSGAFYRVIPGLVLLVSIGSSVFQQRQQYFSLTPVQVFEQTYPGSPFVAAVMVADYVKQNSTPNAQIAVLGSEPEIYFYANRHSAVGYLYTYSLIVRQKYTSQMRQELIHELSVNHPNYLVYVDVWDSWGDRDAPQITTFVSALGELMDRQYVKVGVAEIGETVTYVWGEAAKSYVPHSQGAMYVLKRKEAS